VKVTLERLREIIIEEVTKEELHPQIAAPAIAAMLRGTDSVATSDIFGDVFDQMYGKGALEDEAERMRRAKEEPEEAEEAPLRRKLGIWTPAQKKAGEHLTSDDATPFDRTPTRGIHEIIQQEYYIYLIEQEHRRLQEGPTPEGILNSSYGLNPDAISPIDLKSGWKEVLADRYAPAAERHGAEMAKELYDKLEDLTIQSVTDISNADIYWQKYLNLGGSLDDVVERAPEGTDIVGTLQRLYQRIRNPEQHAQ